MDAHNVLAHVLLCISTPGEISQDLLKDTSPRRMLAKVLSMPPDSDGNKFRIIVLVL